MVKDYGWQLRHDPAYAQKAARISAATRDLAEVLFAERAALAKRLDGRAARKVAWHPPCTLCFARSGNIGREKKSIAFFHLMLYDEYY
jgi:hypothetical protein